MKVFLVILALAVGQLQAIQVSSNCLNGVTDPWVCCKGVPALQDVLLRNINNCGTYYQCVHEVPLLRDCPTDLHWSVSANRCEWPNLAGCDGANTTPPPTNIPTVNPTTEGNTCGNVVPKPTPEGCIKGNTSAEECCKGIPYWQDVLLPNPEDCGSYLQCVHEVPMVRPCPSGLHWSIANNRCEWPNIAKCNETEHGENGSSGEINENCMLGYDPEECCRGVPYNVDILFKNPDDCGTYYQCVHEKPILRPCPAGLHWGVKQNRCEWQNVAKCEEILPA